MGQRSLRRLAVGGIDEHSGAVDEGVGVGRQKAFSFGRRSKRAVLTL
jgi:hypothetical protein